MNKEQKSLNLYVRGMSHVPSFKNNKRAIQDRTTGKMRTLTEPKTKEWMDRVTKSFAFQLCSSIQTTEGETLTAERVQSLIALLPPDDCWQVISELVVTGRKVEPGEEGAVIEITRL